MTQRSEMTNRRMLWIEDWLTLNETADVLNLKFHDEYYAKFGGQRRTYLYGAAPVRGAMLDLKRLYDDCRIRRTKVSLNRMGDEYPNWCYVYHHFNSETVYESSNT